MTASNNMARSVRAMADDFSVKLKEYQAQRDDGDRGFLREYADDVETALFDVIDNLHEIARSIERL